MDKVRDIKPGLLSDKPIVNDSCSDSDSDSSLDSKTPEAYKPTVTEKSPAKATAERSHNRSRSRDNHKHKRSHDSHGHSRHHKRSRSRDRKYHKHRDSSKSDNRKHRESSKSERHKHRESSKSDKKESPRTERHIHKDQSKSNSDRRRDSPHSDNRKHRDLSRPERPSRKSPKRSPSPRDEYPGKRRNYKDDLRDQYCDDAMDPMTRATKLASNVDFRSGKGRVERARKAQDYQAKELVKKAEKLTGITLPKFYKPSAINPLKFAETEQKRKLLWSKKNEPSEENKTVWNVTSVIASRGDDKVAAKFKKLMGIHDNTDPLNHNLSDLSRKAEEQAELFRRLDADYQSARTHTHTSRGVGLGYNQSAFIDPSAYLAGRRDVN